jgi:CRP/FNR family transcriptional regulator, cyclic AMP receptor protein
MAIREFLERTALFSQVDAGLAQRLSEVASTHTYLRGAALWRVGDFPHSLVFVKSGLVKLTRPAPKGRTALCGLFGAPTSIGELVMVKGVPYQTGAVAATAHVTIVSLPRRVALDALRQDTTLALNLFCGFEQKMAALHDKIDVLSAGSVEARLATLLLKLYQQFGDDFDDGVSRIAVPLSRQELADMVSTSFETAIRVFARWEREGSVETDADGFTLRNLDRLRELSGDFADRSGLPLVAPGTGVGAPL